MKLALVIDPLETLKVAMDTSLLIASEAHRRGHEVYVTDPKDLHRDGNGAYASLARLPYDKNSGVSPADAALPPEKAHLSEFDIVIMRKDPPVDEAYTACTFILDDARTRVLNSPTGIRNFNEKIHIMNWSHIIPEMIVSCNIEEILSFSKQFEHGLVVKPINLFNGRGIHKIDAANSQARELVGQATKNQTEFVVAQRFVPDVARGDKRIFLIEGKPIGWMNRIPATNDWRANIHRGATPEKFSPNERDLEIVEAIAPTLAEMDLPIACIDIIGGFLTEVNVTSPSGIPEINAVENDERETLIVDFLEREADC